MRLLTVKSRDEACNRLKEMRLLTVKSRDETVSYKKQR